MLGRVYNTLKDFTITTINFVSQTYQDLKDFGRILKAKKPRGETLKKQFQQFWSGLTQALDVRTFWRQLTRSQDTRRILSDSVISNLIFYLGPVLFYEIFIKNLPYGNESIKNAITWSARAYFLRRAINTFLANSVTNITLAGSAAEDFPENLADIKPCGCPSTHTVRGGVSAAIHQLANAQAASYFQSKLPYGADMLLGSLLKGLAFGQAFLEYKAGTQKICTMHRHQDILAPNVYYSLGLGVAYVGTFEACRGLLYLGLNVESAFLEDALLHLLTQYFTVLIFTNSKRLPAPQSSRDGGWDVFRPVRIAIEPVLGAAALIASRLVITYKPSMEENNEEQKTVEPEKTIHTNKLSRIRNFPPTRLLFNILIEKYFHSLKNFTKSKEFYEFILLYGKSIEGYIKDANNMRSQYLVRFIGLIKDYIPNAMISNDIKISLDILLGKPFDIAINKADTWIKDILKEEVAIRVFHKEALKMPAWDYEPKKFSVIPKDGKNKDIAMPALQIAPALKRIAAPKAKPTTSIKPQIIENHAPSQNRNLGTQVNTNHAHPKVSFFSSNGNNKLLIAADENVAKATRKRKQ